MKCQQPLARITDCIIHLQYLGRPKSKRPVYVLVCNLTLLRFTPCLSADGTSNQSQEDASVFALLPTHRVVFRSEHICNFIFFFKMRIFTPRPVSTWKIHTSFVRLHHCQWNNILDPRKLYNSFEPYVSIHLLCSWTLCSFIEELLVWIHMTSESKWNKFFVFIMALLKLREWSPSLMAFSLQ